MGTHLPHGKGYSSDPTFLSMSIVAKWSPISATAEHLSKNSKYWCQPRKITFFIYQLSPDGKGVELPSYLLLQCHFSTVIGVNCTCLMIFIFRRTSSLIFVLKRDVKLQLTSEEHTHTHNRFMALFPGPPGWAGAWRELHFLKKKKQNICLILLCICKDSQSERKFLLPDHSNAVLIWLWLA